MQSRVLSAPKWPAKGGCGLETTPGPAEVLGPLAGICLPPIGIEQPGLSRKLELFQWMGVVVVGPPPEQTEALGLLGLAGPGPFG